MSEFIRIITHARRLKSATKELSIEHLKEISKKLQTIIENRELEEKDKRKQEKERYKKIEQYRDMLAKDGIGADELFDPSVTKPGKRAPRPPKYEIWNEAGQRITWTGQGRIPNVFKARVDEGEPLDTFLIDS